MKKVIAILLLAVTTSVTFAQKNELKAAEKALKKADIPALKSAIKAAEGLMSAMDEKSKVKFYYLKAKAMFMSGSNSDLESAVESFNQLRDAENKLGKPKYTADVEKLATDAVTKTVANATKSFENRNYADAAKGFELAYNLSPKDTTYLYYAASAAVTHKDYDSAIKMYEKLKELKFTGITTQYLATDKDTGEEQLFSDKSTRDLYVKAKSHIKPRDNKTESKLGEIVKNIGFIYMSQDKNDEALKAIEDAKKLYPDDNTLIVSAANIYMKMDKREEAFALYSEALSKNPDDKDLNYNVAVFNMNFEKHDEASKYFKKALALDPSYADAALNLSFIEIEKGNKLNDQMNSLGTKASDFKKYDELKAKKNEFFKKGVDVLETFIAKNPNSNNLQLYTQLKNIYSALGETDKVNELKAKIANM